MSDHRPAGDNPPSSNRGTNILSAFQLHQLSLKRFIGRYLNNAQDIEVCEEGVGVAVGVGLKLEYWLRHKKPRKSGVFYCLCHFD